MGVGAAPDQLEHRAQPDTDQLAEGGRERGREADMVNNRDLMVGFVIRHIKVSSNVTRPFVLVYCLTQ